MKKVLFIDRDGTLIREPEDEQVDSLDKFHFLPGVLKWLGKIRSEMDYDFVMVTNQDGLGTDSFPESDFWPLQNLMLRVFSGEGIFFDDILIDRSFPHEGLPTRKPGTGLLQKYLGGPYDLKSSFVIGDRESDMELASRLGSRAIGIGSLPLNGATQLVQDWQQIYTYLRDLPRTSRIQRKTFETDVRVQVDLDGKGSCNIDTGIGFFDHMLEQIGKHGGFDLDINCTGDLRVDTHHSIEDVALGLGEAVNSALGMRRGIDRYAFLLPMDESLAQVAIDLGGRPGFVWQGEFKRDTVGELPTEMIPHFFKSFSDRAQCTLHISVTGENEHHKIESIFKAFGKVLGLAARRGSRDTIPSTKGVI